MDAGAPLIAVMPGVPTSSSCWTGLARHSEGVARLAVRLAAALGLESHERALIAWGALVHDVGKYRVPTAILLKPGPLDPEERAIIEQHPDWGAAMLDQTPELVRAVALSHHEHWDGGGYPLRLRGEQIPLAARIVSVCDVYDSLTHERPYRRRWTCAQVARYLRERRGTQFDPRVVDVFLDQIVGACAEEAPAV